MPEDNKPMMIAALILLAIFFFNNPGTFTIFLESPQVQYNNEPIVAEFKLANFSNPLITAFFNDVQIFEISANETNDTISFEKNLINNTHKLTVSGITGEGVLKLVVTESNFQTEGQPLTEVETIEVRDPFVDVTHNLLNVADKGSTVKIEVRTRTPQGDSLEADSVLVEVTDPNSNVQFIDLDKSGDTFTKNFNYEEAGNYIFKINAKRTGFDTREVTAITSVIKTSGVHPIVWIWIAAIVVWVALFGFKFARNKL